MRSASASSRRKMVTHIVDVLIDDERRPSCLLAIAYPNLTNTAISAKELVQILRRSACQLILPSAVDRTAAHLAFRLEA